MRVVGRSRPRRLAGRGIDAKLDAGFDVTRARAGEDRQAEIDRVAKEDARERDRENATNAKRQQRGHRLLARGADSEEGASDDDVPFADAARETRIEGLKAMHRHFSQGDFM